MGDDRSTVEVQHESCGSVVHFDENGDATCTRCGNLSLKEDLVISEEMKEVLSPLEKSFLGGTLD